MPKHQIILLILIAFLSSSIILLRNGLWINNFDLLILAICFLWLNLMPIFHYLLVGYKNVTFPYLIIVSFFNSLSFSIPVFFIRNSSYEVANMTTQTLFYANIGYFLFYLTYILFYKKLNIRFKFSPIKKCYSLWQIKLLAFLFYGIYNIEKFYSIVSVKFIAFYGLYIFFGTYLYLYNQKYRLSFTEKLILLFATGIEFLQLFTSGYIAPLFIFILYLTIIHYSTSKKSLRIILIAATFILIYKTLAPAKYLYREKVEFSNKKYSQVEKFYLLLDCIRKSSLSVYKNEYSKYKSDKYSLFWRASYQASAFSLILKKTPNEIPYFDGNTYVFWHKFIPRIFWPEKPKDNAALKFNHRFGLIPPEKNSSVFPLPILGEMYLNFGQIGFIVGMPLLALIYICLVQVFTSNKISKINVVYASAVVLRMVYHEGNFTMVFGNIPLLVLIIIIICRAHILITNFILEKVGKRGGKILF